MVGCQVAYGFYIVQQKRPPLWPIVEDLAVHHLICLKAKRLQQGGQGGFWHAAHLDRRRCKGPASFTHFEPHQAHAAFLNQNTCLLGLSACF